MVVVVGGLCGLGFVDERRRSRGMVAVVDSSSCPLSIVVSFCGDGVGAARQRGPCGNDDRRQVDHLGDPPRRQPCIVLHHGPFSDPAPPCFWRVADSLA